MRCLTLSYGGRTQAAHKLREIAILVVNWAVERDELETNFLLSRTRSRRHGPASPERTKRSRTFSATEIKAVRTACQSVGRPFADIVRLLFVFGQRRDETAGMEWRELDLEQSLWIIPATRYNTALDHVVPLPAIAVELLRRLPKIDDVYVFSTKPGTRFSGYSKPLRHLRRLSGIAENWTLHDIRRTVRTGISPLTVAGGAMLGPDIAERVLGHIKGGIREPMTRTNTLTRSVRRWTFGRTGCANRRAAARQCLAARRGGATDARAPQGAGAADQTRERLNCASWTRERRRQEVEALVCDAEPEKMRSALEERA